MDNLHFLGEKILEKNMKLHKWYIRIDWLILKR
ncbi:hypothetical protein HNP21_006065 [Bacillus aryabhattai]|uniref:Uncharacterized protein n=1 Tax=Priestia aryabhattai TaxID=412384 RepID=A0A7W3RIM7_PRIAR|nr:hypothetical protein [Priestia aryabhattai]